MTLADFSSWRRRRVWLELSSNPRRRFWRGVWKVDVARWNECYMRDNHRDEKNESVGFEEKLGLLHFAKS